MLFPLFIGFSATANDYCLNADGTKLEAGDGSKFSRDGLTH